MDDIKVGVKFMVLWFGEDIWLWFIGFSIVLISGMSFVGYNVVLGNFCSLFKYWNVLMVFLIFD